VGSSEFVPGELTRRLAAAFSARVEAAL
jgi:hypothetical protein